MRLIDADALMNELNEAQIEFDEYYKGLGKAKVITDNALTVDLELIIKALEQEPILDKIRTEIADLDDADYDYEGYYKAVTDALQVIDKYRQEG